MRGNIDDITERRVILNYVKRKGGTPVFNFIGICMGCGKEKQLNAFRFCEECWITP